MPSCASRSPEYQEFFLFRFQGLCEEIDGLGASPDVSDAVVKDALAVIFDLWTHVKQPQAWVSAFVATLYLRLLWRDERLIRHFAGHVIDPRNEARERRAWLEIFVGNLSRTRRSRLLRAYDGLKLCDVAATMGLGPILLGLELDARYSGLIEAHQPAEWSRRDM